MGPSSRLLVATDLSGPSLRAVDRAFELARESGAACTVLHAMGMDLEGAWRELLGQQAETVSARAEALDAALVVKEPMRGLYRRALERLHELARRVGLGPADYASAVLHGSATRLILSQARHEACDLVVMGKHGLHVTEALLLGSVTKRVLAESRSDVPVVVDERRPHATTADSNAP